MLRNSVSLLALMWAGVAAAQGAAPIVRLPQAGSAVQAQTPSSGPARIKVEAAGAAAGSPTAVLLRQAEGWRKRGRNDLVREALDRARRAGPNDPEVLYHVALYAAQDGQAGVASEYLERLRGAVGPKDRRVVEVANLLAGGAATPPPPSAVAPRREEVPADQPIATRAAQAPARPVDPSGAARAAGFVAFNAGDLATAERRFQEALRQRASDTDASGGLGLVRLRQERFADAAGLLGRAARASGGERWREALQSAQFFAGLQSARADLAAGRLDQAATTARSLAHSGGKNVVEASMVLAEVLTAQARYAEAADAYREVLAQDPQRLDARAGLAEALGRTGQVDEAARMASTLPRTAEGAAQRGRIERARAEALQARGDAFGAGAALAASVTADPANPWSRYQYARFLVGQGQAQQAAQVATPLFTAEAPDIDTLQAAALYAEFAGRPDQALAILGRIPEGARNEAVRDLAQRLDIQAVIERAKAQQRNGDAVQAVAMLRDYVAQNTLPFAARSRAAGALFELGDSYQAGALALAAAHDPLPEGVRPGDAAGFIDVLGATGQDEPAATLLNGLAQTAQTAEDQASWRQIYAGYSVRTADRLRQSGDFARAFDTLSAAFTVAPRNTDLLAALGRLYQAGNLPDKAAQVYDALLQQKPSDPAILLDAARAASSAHDLNRAASLVKMAIELKPTDPELFYELGRIEQARGHERDALRALRRAEALLQGPSTTIGGGLAGAGGPLGPNPFAGQSPPVGANIFASPASPAWPGAAPSAGSAYGMPANSNPAAFPAALQAAPAAAPQTLGQASGPMFGAPARPAAFAPAPAAAPAYPLAAPAAALPGWVQPPPRRGAKGAVDPTAPLGTRVHGEIATLQEDAASRLEGQVHARIRSGEQGASRLAEVSARTTVAGTPFGRGRLGLVIEPVWLNSGTPTGSAAQQSGANELLGVPAENFPVQKSRSATGAAISATYDGSVVHADAGTTPLGFSKTRVNAGLSLTPKVGPVVIRASVAQRPVTDSVLSYAGETDPVTGTKMGAVMRRQAGLGLATDFGRAGVYADAYAKRYTGAHVVANAAYELNAGGYLRAYDDGETQLQVGVNVNLQHFQRNLRFFSLGHGGYFSPQSYMAASLPLTFTYKGDRWRFSGSVAPGLQSYSEDAARVFPKDKALQDRLASLTIVNPNVVVNFPGGSRTGFGIAGHGQGEYHLDTRTFAGVEASFDNFGPYSEYVFNIYLRQLLSAQ